MCAGRDTTEIEPTACLGSSDYPSRFWANLDEQGKSYTERVCCDKSSSEGCRPRLERQSAKTRRRGAEYGCGLGDRRLYAHHSLRLGLWVGYYQHHKSKSAAQNQAPAARAPPPMPMAVAEPPLPPSSGPCQRRPGRRHGAR